MDREPVKLQEWQQGMERPTLPWQMPDGEIPSVYAARIDELRAVYHAAVNAEREKSTIRRVPSVGRCQRYLMPDGSYRVVENQHFEASYYGPLANIDSPDCAEAVRLLGVEAGRWAETAADAAGISHDRAVLQERQQPTINFRNCDWNLVAMADVRGRLMEDPIGELITDCDGHESSIASTLDAMASEHGA